MLRKLHILGICLFLSTIFLISGCSRTEEKKSNVQEQKIQEESEDTKIINISIEKNKSEKLNSDMESGIKQSAYITFNRLNELMDLLQNEFKNVYEKQPSTYRASNELKFSNWAEVELLASLLDLNTGDNTTEKTKEIHSILQPIQEEVSEIRDTLLDISENNYSDWINKYNECVKKFDNATKDYNDCFETVNNLILGL